MIRAAGYIRVSTHEQAAGGISLEMQEKGIAAECERRGWELVNVFSDPGVSATKWRRPGLQALLGELESYDALVVYRLDRLGRSVAHLARILESLKLANVEFVSLTEQQFDTTTPLGKAMLWVSATFAQLERDQTAERVTDAMQAKTERGEWVGRTPLGYRLVEKQLVPDDRPSRDPQYTQADLVREVFRRYVLEHASTQGLAAWLTERLEQRKGKGLYFGIWSASDIGRLLSRPVYAGSILWNDQMYPAKHEALVNPEIFDAAQDIRRARGIRRGAYREYLLSGLLRCRRCGGPMTGHRHNWRRKSGPYEFATYECSRSHTSKTMCKGSYISAGKAERLTFEFLRALSHSTAAELREIRRVAPESSNRRRLELRLKRIGEERLRLGRMLSKELLTEDDYKALIGELETEQKQLSEEQQRGPKGPPAAELRRTFRNIAELLESPEIPFQHKRDALGVLVESMVVHPDGTKLGGMVEMAIRL
jgi:site-specific DNA recombinase